ncbi:type VII secretion-associated serine protease mycosin [Pseudonocardia adelaidensis]|uniref:Peptidase S8/S53 domain-containing protein n=1 Tax=Pseudonocardia adelaidensis TaxID=648754 RepID=A0ABP9P8D5_9PSEU
MAPPRGLRPDPAPGIRATRRCTPPRADASGAGTVAARMRLDDLQLLATGLGQVVAVIDTGVAPHPLLGSRLRGGGDYLTGGDGLEDCDGHGTAVAGLIAAGPAGAGRTATPVGIAPQARLLAIRQSSPSFDVPAPDGGRRAAGDTTTLAEAVVLAIRSGADVVNISEAVCLPAARAAAAGAPLQAALQAAAAADVVVVAAAGNVGSGSCTAGERDQVALPGWYDADVLTVGAVGPGDAPAPFTMPGPWVDVAAPGTGLRSLAVGGGTTGGLDGTSFAAPWVAGLAALVRERFPELTAPEVVDRILATARSSPGDGGTLGHGVVDPVAALTALPARLVPAPEGPADAAALVAELPGTRLVRDAPRAPDSPLDLLAAAVLLAAAFVAVVLLRRPGRVRLRDGEHVDHPTRGGQVQGGSGREQA